MAAKYPPITGNLFRTILRKGISLMLTEQGAGDNSFAVEKFELENQLRLRNEDSLLSSICQQYRNVSPREYVSDSIPLPSAREKKVKLVTVSTEQEMEENPLEILAQTQPAVSQEFNDIMASLALQIQGGVEKK